MKTLVTGIAFAAAAVAAEPGSFQSAALIPAAAPHPAMYSFADVYRLTLAGPVAALPALEAGADAPIRVAVAQAQPAEPRFSISQVPPPDKWLLVLAGLALAGWVAHRRLVHTL